MGIKGFSTGPLAGSKTQNSPSRYPTIMWVETRLLSVLNALRFFGDQGI